MFVYLVVISAFLVIGGDVIVKNGDVELSGNNIGFASSHDRCKIDLWTTGDNGHCIGTSGYTSHYGSNSDYSNTIEHQFHTYQDDIALQIGDGGSGESANKNNVYITDKLSINTTTETHSLVIKNRDADDVLRLLGPDHPTLEQGARINFGDGDYVYIEENTDDSILIHAGGWTYIDGIAAASGTDYVCVSDTGILSSGSSCTRFEDIGSSTEQVVTGQFKVIKIVSENYPLDHPLEFHRGNVKNYLFTIAFKLDSNIVEGTIKVPGNMQGEKVADYLAVKIKQEQSNYAPVRKVVSSSIVGQAFDIDGGNSDFNFNEQSLFKK